MAMFNGLMYSAVSAGGGVAGLSTANGGTAIADNAIIRGDGTTGIQGSTATISDAGDLVVSQDEYITRSLYIGGATAAASSNVQDGSGMYLKGAYSIEWGSGLPDAYGYAGDVGLARAAAGVLKVTDGGSGDGSIRVAVGSYGAPSYSFDDDPDTGMYADTADTIKFAVGGSRRLYLNSTGLYPTVGVFGDGDAGHYIEGFLNHVVASTAGSGSPRASQIYESGCVFTNEGSTAENYHTLPPAAAGYEFTFIVQDTDGIRITASTGDTIRPIAGTAASATGGFIRCATAGAFIRLQAINATEWIATGSAGVWTIDV